jgi:predicted DNA-binding transcriptional regulator YafY
VLTLLELLQSGGVRTTAELASRLGVDERTVRRYVDHLLDLDVPVESVRGRYGGYRLGAGYRMPPLMLSDDEALAVLLGLIAGQRSGMTTAAGTASETAAAKIRRVLPGPLGTRLDAVLESVAFTTPPHEPTEPETRGSGARSSETAAPAPPETATLLTIADAVRHHRPVAIRYTSADGRKSERVLHPYGLVAHSGRWYVTGADPELGEERTFRLDRIADARVRPGSFDPPPDGFDPAARLLEGFAAAPYQHEVRLRVQGTPAQVRVRLPASLATITEPPPPDGAQPETTQPETTQPETVRWLQVDLRVEQLDWLPPLLASLDLPFVIEHPARLRDLVAALAGRLAAYARSTRLPDDGGA